jgi:hypothetical protein
MKFNKDETSYALFFSVLIPISLIGWYELIQKPNDKTLQEKIKPTQHGNK